MLLKSFVLLITLLIGTATFAQEKAVIFGRITNQKGNPVELANIAISGVPGGTITDKKGRYELKVPANRALFISFTYMGYSKEVEKVNLKPGERKEVNKTLEISSMDLTEVEVEGEQLRAGSMSRIDPKIAINFPNSSDAIPAILKTLPGVSSNNELSSQYSVRGGNFDENLIYVNDIEIYRPFLIRSGQQEGLSFVNSDLTSSLLFSAGGFDAKYGDKMSSVLDIQYKKPYEFGGSASISLLGASFHVEGMAAKKTEGKADKNKFTYLLGVRYKTSKYLLNALETKGDYQPSFLDIQSLLTYDISKKLELSLLMTVSQNQFRLIPESRETDFGTVQNAKRLTIYFDGQEADKYLTYLGGLTFTYKPNRHTRLKLIGSGYNSKESETYDLMGQYWIGQVSTDFGSENFGDVVENQGVGTQLEHARNRMDINVYNIEHKATMEKGENLIQWGLKFQHENVTDEMREWTMIDSAGYTQPRPPDSIGYVYPGAQVNYAFEMMDYIKTNANITSNRYTAFAQNTWTHKSDSSMLLVTAGIRANYWDFSQQIVVSPRITVSYKPNWKRDIMFRFSTGYYFQPPFYREIKDIDGTLNYNPKAQESIHFVLGSDLNFKAWGRPFKFITEVYYKSLNRLIPYMVDNVRIRYYAFDQSHGYTTGIDFKINGEFVPGIESWASLSVMSTAENVDNDNYINSEGVEVKPGFIPRPTDQTVNFSLFFQDYLPRNPTYKMSLTLIFGSSLPFGPPDSPRYKQTLRMPPYRRVDIGFSKELIGEYSRFSPKNPLRGFKSVWLTLEILNLLQINNTVSYTWVTDVYGEMYAVPNYLTTRQLNIKLVARF